MELKAGVTIETGVKLVLLNHLIPMLQVGTIKFNEISKAITQSNPNGKRKMQMEREAKALDSQLCLPSGFIRQLSSVLI